MNTFKIYITAAVIVLAAPTFSYAGTLENLNAIRAEESDCNNQAVTTVAMGECIRSAHSASDRLLNQQYKAIVNSFGSSVADRAALERLRNAERNWIKFRDAECSQELSEGTSSSLNYVTCLYLETSKRIEALDTQFALRITNPTEQHLTDEERGMLGSGGGTITPNAEGSADSF